MRTSQLLPAFPALVLLAFAATAPPLRAGQAPPAAKSVPHLAGTFLVTATFTDPAELGEVEVLITFIPGRGGNEGTLVDTNAFQLTPNPVCSPDQGVWRRDGSSYVATHYNFCFDANDGYAPAGPTKIRDRLFLSDGGETLTGTQYIEGFDTAGNLVFVGKATLHGTRVRAEAPPSE
jgi:hypothetical protein